MIGGGLGTATRTRDGLRVPGAWEYDLGQAGPDMQFVSLISFFFFLLYSCWINVNIRKCCVLIRSAVVCNWKTGPSGKHCVLVPA